MARLDCFKGPDVSRMTHEWERDREADGTWAFKPSSKIDPSRTGLNYRMEDGRADARLARRLSDPGLKVDGRSHVNKAGVWVVTCPQELKDDPDAVRRFFELVYDFTKERYGAENVLQGYVHMDETTPHIHMPVVPVRDGRVSAKAVFNRRELPAYQRELDKVVAVEFGQKGFILNGRTKGGYTTAELRERTEAEARVRQEADRIRADARKSADMEKAFTRSMGRRYKQDAARMKEQEAAFREREAELERREAAVKLREADLDAVGKAMLRRRQEARQEAAEGRYRERVQDGAALLERTSSRPEGPERTGRPGGPAR